MISKHVVVVKDSGQAMTESSAAKDSSANAGAGIFRDGSMLVLTLRHAEFPDQCLVTDQPTTGKKFRYREKISPQKARDMARYGQAAWKGAAAAVGTAAAPIGLLSAAAIIATMTEVVLNIGLADELQTRFRRRKSLALWMIFGGLFFTFVVPSPMLYWEIENIHVDPLTQMIFIVLMIGGFVVMLAGLLYFAVAVRQPIKILATDGAYAWFAGVHQDFLARLPKFAPQQKVSGR